MQMPLVQTAVSASLDNLQLPIVSNGAEAVPSLVEPTVQVSPGLSIANDADSLDVTALVQNEAGLLNFSQGPLLPESSNASLAESQPVDGEDISSMNATQQKSPSQHSEEEDKTE